MRSEGTLPTVIRDVPSDDFAQIYSEASSTGPERFGFDADGRLETTSERVALLESLHRNADHRGDAEVAALSRAALDDTTSTANERIVALRNVALHSSEGRDELGGKLRAFLAEPGLADEAPFAFLQALDGVVHLEDASFAVVLDRLADGEGLLTSTATKLALQRLATVNPLGVLRELNAEPSLLQRWPAIRADLVASIDPSDPDSVVEVERYLRRDDVELVEKRKMIHRMDQPAFVIADGIFTRGALMRSPAGDRLEQVERIHTLWRQCGDLSDLWDETGAEGAGRR